MLETASASVVRFLSMKCAIVFLLGILGLCFDEGLTTAQTLVFSTGFEVSEGYDEGFTLVGQNGWVSSGSGGNGILTNFFEGEGQQGFIGFTSPTNSSDAF